jgi:sugar/nucleoside kinase (ribokinase family)
MTSAGVSIVAGVSIDHIVRAGSGAVFDVPGGPGTYASLAARAVAPKDCPVRLETRLHPDLHGVAAMLTDAGVDLTGCTWDGRLWRLWILDSPEGRRIVPVDAGRTTPEVGAATVDPSAPDDLVEPSWDRSDAIVFSAPSSPVTRPASWNGVLAVDPDQRAIAREGWAYLEAFAGVDVLLPSRVQLRQLGTDERAVAAELRRRLDCSIVARLDADGCVVLPRGGGEWVTSPGREVPVVDTTGAGDVHAGALVASLRSDPSASGLVESAALATAAASAAIGGWGPDRVRTLTDRDLERFRPAVRRST